MPRAKTTRASSQPKKEEGAIQAGEKDLKFKLVGGKRPVSYKFPSSVILRDPETKKERKARYVEGYTTYWYDEQPEDVRRTPVIFIDGDLSVTRDKIALQEYLLACIKDQGDLCSIMIDDPEAENRDKNRIERLIVKAKSMVFDRQDDDKGMEEIKVVARYFQIPVEGVDNETIVTNLLEVAGDKRRVERFIEAFDSPFVRMKSLMMQGIELSLFDVSNDREVRDAKTGNVICPVPIGKDAVDALTSYALSDKGAELVKYVEDYV